MKVTDPGRLTSRECGWWMAARIVEESSGRLSAPGVAHTLLAHTLLHYTYSSLLYTLNCCLKALGQQSAPLAIPHTQRFNNVCPT